MGLFRREKTKPLAEPEAPQRLLQQDEVVVPIEHVHPKLWEELHRSTNEYDALLMRYGMGFEAYEKAPLTVTRSTRSVSEILLGVAAGAALHPQLPLTAAMTAAAAVAVRTISAVGVQRSHEHLMDAMGRYGVLNTQFEGHYPMDWMHPSIIRQTHPIFYVDGKFNLHFLRSRKRGEATRYRWQQTRLGRCGVTLWRWRAYLHTPKFPAREASKAREWVARMTSQLRLGGVKLAPARVRGMRFRRMGSAGRQRARPR